MEEILRGIWHWSAAHPQIKIAVHSYYLSDERTLIDPIAPDDGWTGSTSTALRRTFS